MKKIRFFLKSTINAILCLLSPSCCLLWTPGILTIFCPNPKYKQTFHLNTFQTAFNCEKRVTAFSTFKYKTHSKLEFCRNIQLGPAVLLSVHINLFHLSVVLWPWRTIVSPSEERFRAVASVY